jgi:hypothetical protein
MDRVAVTRLKTLEDVLEQDRFARGIAKEEAVTLQ